MDADLIAGVGDPDVNGDSADSNDDGSEASSLDESDNDDDDGSEDSDDDDDSDGDDAETASRDNPIVHPTRNNRGNDDAGDPESEEEADDDKDRKLSNTENEEGHADEGNADRDDGDASNTKEENEYEDPYASAGEEEAQGGSEDASIDDDDDPDYEPDDDGDEETSNPRSGEQVPRRSTRERKPVDRLEPKMTGKSHAQKKKKKTSGTSKKAVTTTTEDRDLHHNLHTQRTSTKDKAVGEITDMEYDSLQATVLAQSMDMFNHVARRGRVVGKTFGPQYLIQKGLKRFGKEGYDAALSEIKQQHDRLCFSPVLISHMTPSERRKAQEALMFLTEKRSGKIKGRMVYNGKPTREWLSREDSASPTASLESIFITITIDAHEFRDMMSADVPNAFIQALLPEPKEGEDRVIMKISGALQLDPNLYGPKVVYEKGRKVVYVQVLRAIYGMLQASLLWYQKFRKDLEEIGFVFNNYDPCVANRMVNGAQQTIRFHVDDLLSSHIDPKVNERFGKWLEKKYGEYKAVEPTRGTKHEYLGMTLDFSKRGKVTVDMRAYVENMLKDFPVKLKSVARTPAGDNLLEKGKGKPLDPKRKEIFHTTVAKGMFLSKRSRPDIHPTIAVLSTRVLNPTESDWKKLVRLMQYLSGTLEMMLTLSADNLRVVKWYVDASFAVHPDYKSHTGAVMTLGSGAVQAISRKQKLNTRSSTEAELVGADDAATMILWTGLFLAEQGYHLEKNILFQDNKSAILLEVNGRKSAGSRSRALNVRYFFLTDQVEKGNLSIEYCPTDDMWGDFMTKPLQSEKFEKFRGLIMG